MRIGLITPYMGWNLGDTAIIEAALAGLHQADPGVEPTLICLDPARASRLHGIAAQPIGVISRPFYPITLLRPSARTKSGDARTSPERQWLRRFWGGLQRAIAVVPGARRGANLLRAMLVEPRHLGTAWQTVRSLDLLILAGGGQLDDEFGGTWGHPYSLVKWLGLARIAGTPTAMCSVGSGLSRTRVSRWFLGLAVRWAGDVSLRDVSSLSAIGLDGARIRHRVQPDLAFATPVGSPTDAWPGTAATARIGISPIAFSKAGSWPTSKAGVFDRYFGELGTFAEQLLARGYELHLFGTDGGDAEVVRTLYERLRARDQTGQRVVHHGIPDLNRYLEIVSHLDLVVASRLHGVILPHVQGRAVLAISYQRKVTAHMEDMRMTWAMRELETVSADQILETFDRVYARRSELSDEATRLVRERRSTVTGSLREIVEKAASARRVAMRTAEARRT